MSSRAFGPTPTDQGVCDATCVDHPVRVEHAGPRADRGPAGRDETCRPGRTRRGGFAEARWRPGRGADSTADGIGRHHRLEEHRRDRVLQRRALGGLPPVTARGRQRCVRESDRQRQGLQVPGGRSAFGGRRAGRARRIRSPASDAAVLGRLEVGGVHGVPEPGRGPAAASPAPAHPGQGAAARCGLGQGRDHRERPPLRVRGRAGRLDCAAEGPGHERRARRERRSGAWRRSGRRSGRGQRLAERRGPHPARPGHRARPQHRQRRGVCLRQAGTLPGDRHRRARQGRQRRPVAQHGIGRRIRARQRQGVLRTPRVDRDGRRPGGREGLRGQAVCRQGVRGHRVHRFRRRGRSEARDVRPRHRQVLSRGHVDQPLARRDVDGRPDGARVRHPHAQEVGCQARRGQAGRGGSGSDREARGARGSARARDAR